MPENPSPGPAWKNQAAKSPAAAASKGEAAVPAWKKEAGGPAPGGPRAWQTQPPTPAPRPTSKLTKLFIGLTLGGVLVGAVVAVVLYLRVLKPASLIVLGASYDVNLSLPHNAHGWQGLDDLAQVAGRGTKEFEMRLAYPDDGEPVPLTDETSWQKQWNEALKANINAKTVLLYLALHGGADEAGAYLFLNEPRLKQKVYVTALLDDVVKQWPSKNVVLILEPGPLDAHWHSGMLENQFVPRLKAAVQDAAKKHSKLLVLCGCDDGQVCWSSDEWRRTIFTHYLAEGLQGAAAGGDGRVHVGELFDYVKKNVSNWAETNRGMRQTPILLGNGSRDTELTQVKESYTERPPQDAPGLTPFTPSRDLLGAWTDCAKLAETAHPSAYTPQQWRRYRDALVRWEQLERAGDPTRAADDLQKLCARLATEMGRAAGVPAGEHEITRAFPLPGVLGIGAGLARDGQSDELQGRFKLLWTAASREKQREILDELKKSSSGPEQTKLVYLALCRELLRFLATSATLERSEEVTVKAEKFVRFLEEEFALPPRPAELHYLVMLAKGLDAKALPPLDDLKQSLEARVLAEQAALAAPIIPGTSAPSDAGPSYSEIVQPFVRATVKAADDQRRLAEDWLFGAGPKEWARARDLRDKALTGYREALKDAAVVRHAVTQRDRALADLPYFAAWLGKRHPQPDPDESAALRKLTTQVEQLSQDIGDLTWCLTEPKVVDGFRGPLNSDRKREARTPKELMEQLAAAIETRHAALRSAFRNHSSALKDTHHQERWHELEAALSVPLIDASVRTNLLQASHGISQKLHQSDKAFAETDRPPAEADRAERQKRLAVAALVANSEDKHPVGLHAKDSPAQLERRIGGYWLELPDRIAKQVKASDLAPDLDEASLKMRDAEFLCRLLPGGIDMAAMDPPVPVSPPASMRRLRLHNLLFHQAERTKEDHWYKEDGAPYYVDAAKAYAYLALDLADAGGKNEALAAARRSKTEKFAAGLAPAGLKITPPANIDWTSELKFPLSWTLDADQGVPRGVPMYWLELQSERADAQDARFAERRAAEDWLPKSAEYSLARRGKVDLYPEPTKANLVALYRGQQLNKQEVALRDWEPRTIVRHVPPRSAGVAFRMAPNFNYGAIAFVLDASGSMFNMLDKKTRWEHALLALEATLDKIPESTYVSVSIFVTRGKNPESLPKHETWRKPKLWKAEELDGLIEKLRALKDEVVQGGSPIAEAIIRARGDDGFPRPNVYQGPKLIVALTDGHDTWSLRQRNNANVDPEIRGLLENEFNNSKTEIHVVCFNEQKTPADRDEARHAQEQFEIVKEFKPPGTFRMQTKPRELADSLDEAIRPRLRLYSGNQLVEGFTREGVSVDRYKRAVRWHAPLAAPGLYTVWLPEEQKQDIHLEPGDFMILTLQRDAAGLYFKRTLLAEENADRMVGAPQTVKGWTAAVLQNHVTAKGDVARHVVAIEEPPPAGASDVQQRRLNFVWLELKPKAMRSYRQLVWQRDYSFPGSALSLRTEFWPFEGGLAVPSQLQAWWTTGLADNPSYAQTLDPSLVESLRAKFAKAPDLRAGSVKLKIENIELETHDVEVAPNQRAPKPCVVFRVSHEPQKPVFIQLRTQKPYALGEEHRYYPEANRYTAIFWNLPDPQNIRLAVNVISVVDFQASSEPVTFALPQPSEHPGPERVPSAVSP